MTVTFDFFRPTGIDPLKLTFTKMPQFELLNYTSNMDDGVLGQTVYNIEIGGAPQ